jgi:hypothetical protein
MRVCCSAYNNISNYCLIKQVLSGSERKAKYAPTLLLFSGTFIENVSEVFIKRKRILFKFLYVYSHSV